MTNSGITQIINNVIPASCLYLNTKVRFRLIIGNHVNIINFLSNNNILFLAELELDFSTIPISLHGKGRSKNLYDYISNNIDNEELILNFIYYFISEITDIRYYYSNTKLIFNVLNNFI